MNHKPLDATKKNITDNSFREVAHHFSQNDNGEIGRSDESSGGFYGGKLRCWWFVLRTGGGYILEVKSLGVVDRLH